MSAGEDLYQRVRALGAYGLLDPTDQAVLDKGETVTRMQLAFYTEKAKAKLSGPVYPTPTPGAVSTAAGATPAQSPAGPKADSDLFDGITLPAPLTDTTPVVQAPEVSLPAALETSGSAVSTPYESPATPADPTPIPTPEPKPVAQIAAPEVSQPAVSAPESAKAKEVSARDLTTEVSAPSADVEKAQAAKAGAVGLDATADKVGAAVPVLDSRPENPSKADTAKEVDELLAILKKDSGYLRRRVKMDDSRLTKIAAQQEALKAAQKDVEKAWGRSNQKSAPVGFDSQFQWRAEDMTVKGSSAPSVPVTVAASAYTFAYGGRDFSNPVTTYAGANIPRQRVSSFVQDSSLSAYADLGIGSISTGFGGSLSSDNGANGSAVTLYLGRSTLDLKLKGTLGTWAMLVGSTMYRPESSLGAFARSGGEISRRYEDPFSIRAYSSNRAAVGWDDFIRSVGFVEQVATNLINSQSTGDRVFDGLILKGSAVPYLGAKTNLSLLLGRLDTRRYEAGANINRPFLRERLSATLAYYTVQDSNGVGVPADLSQKNIAVDLSYNLGRLMGNPLLFHVEGGQSRLFTGTDLWTSNDPEPLLGLAGRATLTWYPFTFEGMYLEPGYSNFNGKATLQDLDFGRYNAGGERESHGTLGESDQMLTNRRGWRFGLGWNGRRTETLRKLPPFLDQVVMNVNVASKTEFQAVPWTQTYFASDNERQIRGRYTVMGPNLVSFYYPEWQGVWANMYAGYTGANPVRRQYEENIGASGGVPFTTYDFRGNTEVVVLRDPATGADLNHRKTFHYFDMTQKIQINKLFHFKKPTYMSVFYSSTRVSGSPVEAGQTAISNLFTRTLVDVALFRSAVLPRTHAMAHVALENWDSEYSIPRVDWRRKVWGVGLAYEIPWGGSMADLRVNRFSFRSASVPANNHDGLQAIVLARFLF